MERVAGTLLAVDEVTVTGRPWVRLWLAAGAERFAAWLPDSLPAVHVVAAEGVDPASLLPLVRSRAEAVEVVERRVGRRTVRLLRVLARHTGDVPDLKKGLEALADVEVVRDADIPIEEAVVADHGLRPMAGLVGEGARDWRVTGWVLSKAESGPEVAVEWRVLALTVEAAEGRIVRIALAPRGRAAETFADVDERALLAAFVERFTALDPDVVLTWNGDAGHFPLLVARAEELGEPLALARDGGPPDVSGAGNAKTSLLAGRAHVDVKRVADRDLKFDVKVKTLASVAEHVEIDVDEAAEGSAPAEAAAVLAVGEALLPLQEAFARLTRLPLDVASRAGRGRQVEAMLQAEAARLSILPPRRHPAGAGGEVEYEGGFVLDPTPGLHEDVVALDFGAMYPTIMIAYNVSPDTHVPEGEEAEGEVNVAPGAGHRFLVQPDGFFRRILRDLVDSRRAMKKRMKTLPEGAERSRLDVEQSSIKVLTNAMYGYTGWSLARWGSRACAEATSAWGRAHIQGVMDDARARGMRVLYGDTDSLFLQSRDGVESFVKDVNAKLPLELDVAERYKVLLFTTAKKKYAGLTADGRLVARGFEIRRGDWATVARRAQEEVLRAVLEARDAKKGLQVARDAVAAVREGRVPVEDLVIWKTLTVRPDAYKVKPFHAAAVERAEAVEPGLRVQSGSKVGIVMAEGSGGAHDRAVLRSSLKPGQKLDAEWYVEKQVVPAALRILESFGVNADEIKGKPKQKSLGDFF